MLGAVARAQTLATGAPWAPPQGRRTGRVPKIGRLSVSLILEDVCPVKF